MHSILYFGMKEIKFDSAWDICLRSHHFLCLQGDSSKRPGFAMYTRHFLCDTFGSYFKERICSGMKYVGCWPGLQYINCERLDVTGSRLCSPREKIHQPGLRKA